MTIDFARHPLFGPARAVGIALALGASACDRANTPGIENEMTPTAEQNELLEAAEANAAVLAQDEDLANEAAADEAADMETFGGNAAAGETGNAGSAGNGA